MKVNFTENCKMFVVFACLNMWLSVVLAGQSNHESSTDIFKVRSMGFLSNIKKV